MTLFSSSRRLHALAIGLAVGAMRVASAQPTLTLEHAFNTDGIVASALETRLTQGRDGSFYGSSELGGDLFCNDGGCGTLFRITLDGKYTAVYTFEGAPNGISPSGGLVLANDGNFYGTTLEGGNIQSCAGGCGTIFRVTPQGVLTTLHFFTSADGLMPSGLVQAADGALYGVAMGGGDGVCASEAGARTACPNGTVFRMTLEGDFSVVHSFGGDGAAEPTSLIQGTDGVFYGTAQQHSPTVGNPCDEGCGTLFKMTADGTVTLLPLPADTLPTTPLLWASNGLLFGNYARASGCPNDICPGFVFRMAPDGTGLTNLLEYQGIAQFTEASLTEGTDHLLYGTTPTGTVDSPPCTSTCGTAFQMSLQGHVSETLYFGNTRIGDPCSALVQARDGSFWSIACQGRGKYRSGAIYRLGAAED